MSTVEDELPRIEALLGTGGYGDAVSRIDADPPADYLSASGAVAYEWSKPVVRAAVYLFDDVDEADRAEDQLHAELDHPSVRTASTTNGSLLLWAMTLADDDAGRDLLDRLRSSFAGVE